MHSHFALPAGQHPIPTIPAVPMRGRTSALRIGNSASAQNDRRSTTTMTGCRLPIFWLYTFKSTHSPDYSIAPSTSRVSHAGLALCSHVYGCGILRKSLSWLRLWAARGRKRKCRERKCRTRGSTCSVFEARVERKSLQRPFFTLALCVAGCVGCDVQFL